MLLGVSVTQRFSTHSPSELQARYLRPAGLNPPPVGISPSVLSGISSRMSSEVFPRTPSGDSSETFMVSFRSFSRNSSKEQTRDSLRSLSKEFF